MSKKSRAQRARERPCRTFFGSHGCKKQRGHSGDHVCGCGEIAAEGRTLFGEDVPGDPDYEPPSELLGEEP